MSDGVLIVGIIVFACLVVVFLTRKAWNKGIENANEASLQVSTTGFSLQFKREASALQQDTSEVEEAAKMLSAAPVGLSTAQLALPGEMAEGSDDAAPGSIVTTRELVAVGADWGGLVDKAKRFLQDNDIPAPEGEPSLGELLQTIDDDWPGILPDKTVSVANRTEQLLEKLMAAQPSEIDHEDISLFSNTLRSLHRTISRSASKARHPGHRRRY
jgi:hypothetical protein